MAEAIKKFMESFEQVFDKDWDYTKEQLGVYEETEQQKQMEGIYIIDPNGTFLNPKVEDEIEDWGHRGNLLQEYRNLKNFYQTVVFCKRRTILSSRSNSFY